MRVTNRSGKTVFTRAVKAQHTYMRVPWDGRDARGRALPRGIYYVKVFGVDLDGLRGSTRPHKVVVSGKRLVTATRTVALSPTASRTDDYPVGCNGCGDVPVCGKVVPSDRFAQAGALSYRSGTDENCEPYRWVAFTRHVQLLHEVAPRGGKTSVSVFGGPMTPGATHQGDLSVVSGSQTATVRTGPDTSDHTTTTPWVPISAPDNRGAGAEWRFSTREGSSYDAAVFTVRFKYLTPRS